LRGEGDETALRSAAAQRILGTSMKRLIFIFTVLLSLSLHAAKLPAQWQIADKDLADYFARETRALSEKCLSNIQSADDWKQHAPEYRAQLA